jgi:phage/plasmid-like protein (TIGR03299 family)
MNEVTLFERTLDVLESTGTNFEVQKIQLQTACGKSTGSFGNFRSDNGEWLGTFKESYQVYQNHELVQLLLNSTESLNLDVTNGGSFKNGARVYYQIQLPDEYIGKSSVKRSITAINSHDGSTAIALGSTNVVVVCNNTFFKAHKELEKVKHTNSAKDRVNVMAMNLKQTIEKDILMMDNFKRMADIEMKDEMVERLIKKLFKADLNKNQEDVSTRTKNNIATFADNLNTEIQLEGKTLWGLFNAVTRYTNHEASPKDETRKIEYLMNGTGFKLSNLAFEDCMEWIESNSHQYVMIER